MVVAVSATYLPFVHMFKVSKRRQTVNERAKEDGQHTIWQRVEERLPRCIGLFTV